MACKSDAGSYQVYFEKDGKRRAMSFAVTVTEKRPSTSRGPKFLHGLVSSLQVKVGTKARLIVELEPCEENVEVRGKLRR